MDLEKFNKAVPRYTSYPTVPFWDFDKFDREGYGISVRNAFWESCKEISLYIHLPFCESLCTYCACSTRITKNHKVEDAYIKYLIKEWKLYLKLLPDSPKIKEIHLGGGTPTFFSPENLSKLLNGVFKTFNVSNRPQFSFEGHPGNTTPEHLRVLYNLGFNRVSFGIQDFDKTVQKLINRRQNYDQVRSITNKAREIGYGSVNYDVVYGLPGQTLDSLSDTIDKIITLKPERIAYYSYAHVPGVRPAQKSYEKELPSPEGKFNLLNLGRQRFMEAGYQEVGMDHFILPEDELVESRKRGDLYRNFMGYTAFTSKLLIGLGVSAISDSWSGFAQNEKNIEKYYDTLDQGKLPITKGHLHTVEDLFIRKHILQLMCYFRTEWLADEFLNYGLNFNHELLAELQENGLIHCDENGLIVHDSGRKFIRLICSALDRDLYQSTKKTVFSQSI